jgi:LysR family transcriptional regulator, hypochlorite-specific transcription factor HypT
MQLKWLEDFVTLSETRNFTRAAELRHVTHPAFGRRIRSLEEWVGVPLLDRTRFPFALTQEGEAFLVNARTALASLYEGRNAANAAIKGSPDLVRFASGTTLAATQMPRWLAHVQAQVGDFQMSVVTGSMQEAIERLSEGHADFAMTYGHPQLTIDLDAKRFDVHDVAGERMVAVVAIDAPFGLPGTAAKPVPLLRLASTLAMSTIVESRLQAAPRIYTRVVQTADSAQALQQFVRAGLGVAWLPYALVEEDIRLRRLREVDSQYDLPMVVRLYRPLGSNRPLLEKIWRATVTQKV